MLSPASLFGPKIPCQVSQMRFVVSVQFAMPVLTSDAPEESALELDPYDTFFVVPRAKRRSVREGSLVHHPALLRVLIVTEPCVVFLMVPCEVVVSGEKIILS